MAQQATKAVAQARADSLTAQRSNPRNLPTATAALEWLIHPITKETFLDEYWERKPLLVKRSQPHYFDSLLSLDEIDRVLTTFDLRHPNIILKNAEKAVTTDDYTLDGEILDVAKIYQLFREGSTITLAYLDDILPPLAAFCRGLETEFSCPFQANVYLTPGSKAKGAKHHYDTHDVFVLQVANSKQWSLYGTPVELPLSGQDFDAAIHPRGEPTLEFQLDAGDVLYVPRGLVHDARSTEELSLHITVGALNYRWVDLLLEFVADASLNDVAFRKSLPAGFARDHFDRTAARATLCDLLQRLAARPNLDAVLDRFIDDFISSCPPLLRGQMAEIEAADRLTVDSVVGAREGSVWSIRGSADSPNDSIAVYCYGRKITFPADAAEAVRFALASPRFAVRDLPGDLDDESKLTLVRRLIREALLITHEN